MANKSYKSSDPYVKYAIEHSLRLSPIQREFLEVLMVIIKIYISIINLLRSPFLNQWE